MERKKKIEGEGGGGERERELTLRASRNCRLNMERCSFNKSLSSGVELSITSTSRVPLV